MSTSDRRPHILLVEDDADVAALMSDQLGDIGYRVSIAVDGTSMRGFLQFGDPVDALIIDCLLPGEQGASLADYAKTLRLPVVMCSGSADAMELAQKERLQLLQKPFRRNDIRDALSRALASGAYGQRDA